MKKLILVVLALALCFAVAACGSKDAEDDPNLGVWIAKTGEMWGTSIEVEDFFDGGFIIELKAGGKCALEIDGKKANGKWTLNDGAFTVKAGGVDCEGRLENGKLLLEDVMGMGIDLIFYKEGSGPLAGDSVDTDTSSELSEALAWWNRDFYGYWTVTSGYGVFESLEDGIWDCYAVFDVRPDGSGTVYIWDDEDEIGTVEIQIDELGGIADMGSATSEGGVLFGMPVQHADWVMMPTYDGYEDYWGNIWPGDYMEIDAYCDLEDGDSISYTIVLRPWGILWEDVPEDNRPPYYENWYKNAGFYEYATILDALEATNSATTEGTSSLIHSALTGGTPAGSSSNSAPSDSGASEPTGGTSGGDAVILDLTNAELSAKWDTFTDEVFARDSQLSGITYESVVKLLGVEGEKTEDRDGFVEYRWYASDDGSLSIRWNTESGEWINSAMNQYGRP